jgi:hypothetical protein
VALIPGTAHALLRLVCEWLTECYRAGGAEETATTTRETTSVDVDVESMARFRTVLLELAELAPRLDFKRIMGEDLGYVFLDDVAEEQIGEFALDLLLQAMLEASAAPHSRSHAELVRLAKCAPAKQGLTPSKVWFHFLRTRLAEMSGETEAYMLALCARVLPEMDRRTMIRAALVIGVPQEKPRRALLQLRKLVIADVNFKFKGDGINGDAVTFLYQSNVAPRRSFRRNVTNHHPPGAT